jgi:hypothetical protein
MRNSRMIWMVPLVAGITIAVLTSTSPLLAASPPTDPTIEVKRALSQLAALDGVWRGPVERTDADGGDSKLTMIARVGPMLDGTIKVLEERTSAADGKLAFSLVAVFSFSSATQEYTVHAYSRGNVRSAVVHLTPGGYYFEMPEAGGATMRLTTKVAEGGWHEIVERLVPGQPPSPVARIELKRTDTSDWPSGEFPSVVKQ